MRKQHQTTGTCMWVKILTHEVEKLHQTHELNGREHQVHRRGCKKPQSALWVVQTEEDGNLNNNVNLNRDIFTLIHRVQPHQKLTLLDQEIPLHHNPLQSKLQLTCLNFILKENSYQCRKNIFYVCTNWPVLRAKRAQSDALYKRTGQTARKDQDARRFFTMPGWICVLSPGAATRLLLCVCVRKSQVLFVPKTWHVKLFPLRKSLHRYYNYVCMRSCFWSVLLEFFSCLLTRYRNLSVACVLVLPELPFQCQNPHR